MTRAGSLMVVAWLVLAAGCGKSRVVLVDGARPQRVASTPQYNRSVTVRRGDSLSSIARAHRISVPDLAAWNRIGPPYTIYPGQRIDLYPRGGSSRRAAATPAPTQRGPAPPVVQVAPPTSTVAWRWPAEGQLVARFQAGEPTRQGIDIAGTGGAPVHAAGPGVVVYSGSGLVGYGELIIVKHDDAWLSAYGHNRERLVNEGQRVQSGEQIARMGRSGAARDMLHFEIRYNGKPVDPLRYLPAR